MNNIQGCSKFWMDKADAKSHGIKKTKQSKISSWAVATQKMKQQCNSEEEKEPQTEIQRESVIRRTKIGSYIFGLLIAGLVPQHLVQSFDTTDHVFKGALTKLLEELLWFKQFSPAALKYLHQAWYVSLELQPIGDNKVWSIIHRHFPSKTIPAGSLDVMGKLQLNELVSAIITYCLSHEENKKIQERLTEDEMLQMLFSMSNPPNDLGDYEDEDKESVSAMISKEKKKRAAVQVLHNSVYQPAVNAAIDSEYEEPIHEQISPKSHTEHLEEQIDAEIAEVLAFNAERK